LKFEDEWRLRASLVLDFYKQELSKYEDVQLSFADKERKQQVHSLLNYMSSLKIIDAPVLLNIYNLYRYKL
jgi:hypothetical protein